MGIKKNHRREQSAEKNTIDEKTWNKEKRNLKKISRLLFYDIQRLESFCCLEVKNTINFFQEVRNFEINLIKTALLYAMGSQRRCAELLGISASTLNNKIKHYGIKPKNIKENRI